MTHILAIDQGTTSSRAIVFDGDIRPIASAQLEFEQHVSMEKEVVECHNITGANEYLLRVETKDLPGYKKFHADVLGECAQVQSITTMVVMDTPKDER